MIKELANPMINILLPPLKSNNLNSIPKQKVDNDNPATIAPSIRMADNLLYEIFLNNFRNPIRLKIANPKG
jgi:hypothetical protein